MPGVAVAALVAICVGWPAMVAAAVAYANGRERPAGASGGDPEIVAQLAATGTPEPILIGPWTLAHAGLSDASGGLTAPREAPSFAANRAAILAAYARTEADTARALRRAGMTKNRGWTCG